MSTLAAPFSITEFLDQEREKDLLRFSTAGSVDDGKSTLIGRLLYDSKSLMEDQLEALQRSADITGGWSLVPRPSVRRPNHHTDTLNACRASRCLPSGSERVPAFSKTLVMLEMS